MAVEVRRTGCNQSITSKDTVRSGFLDVTAVTFPHSAPSDPTGQVESQNGPQFLLEGDVGFRPTRMNWLRSYSEPIHRFAWTSELATSRVDPVGGELEAPHNRDHPAEDLDLIR